MLGRSLALLGSEQCAGVFLREHSLWPGPAVLSWTLRDAVQKPVAQDCSQELTRSPVV